MLRIKCYDNYQKQWLYILLGEDDEMWDWRMSGPDGVIINQNILFQSIEGDKDTCNPKRWSDLTKFEIIKK